ncbi:hypothetical protein GGTG_09122 [Gaeumannomyces tritici R3-111a-1]|uniref:S-(Hydroxymethyl)glutathione dehydrogenase n=1 Tax=Gaeumannomyces tritici (strain R3-111a-1) TaxID=644352 RepID=J3P6I1_GAET3|nr:hypothetical protein GGTG_09122 [Gaeumannomyces tritici R3-111a-1]EJT72256.1 hypothetical protein GGTG_09122 [Gaeumannomyces tritici R3-111a-1]
MSSTSTSPIPFRPRPKTNRVVMWEGKVGQVVTREIPFPRIEEPEDVIVRITTSALCGTDLHVYRGFMGSPNVPYSLGHEGMGVVHEIGPAVDSFKVGDRVIIAFPSDRPIPTKNSTVLQLAGFGLGSLFGDLQGLQAEYVRVPFADSSLVGIPKTLPDKEWLCTGDIFSTAWQGLTWSGFEAGDSVAVFGAGPVGLLCAYSAVIRGASAVYVVDHIRQRLDKAESIGPAVRAIDFTKPGHRASEQILALSPGGVNRAVDCVGEEALNEKLERQQDYILRECVHVTAVGGGIGVPGATTVVPKSEGAPLADEIAPEIAFPIAQFWTRGLSMKASFVDPVVTMPMLLRLIESGRAKPGFIVDEPAHDLSDAPRQYERFNRGEVIKVLFKGAPRPEEWEEEEWERDAGEANGHGAQNGV